jgi:hypothetical protein
MVNHEKFQDILNKDFGKSFMEILSCKTLYELVSKIQNISSLYKDYGYDDFTDRDGTIKLGSSKFKGDLFEIFAECFFILFSSDDRVGIYNYKPVPSDEDNGVDGTCKNINGLNSTVQIKFKSDPTYELLERDIKQFPFQSYRLYDVDMNEDNNMIIFTTCKGLNWKTEKDVFDNTLRVINGEFISNRIDNNQGFWNSFKDLISKSIIEIGMNYITIN